MGDVKEFKPGAKRRGKGGGGKRGGGSGEEPPEPSLLEMDGPLREFRDSQTGRFLSGNPGRPEGARNLVNREFSRAMREFNETAGMEIICHLLGSPDDRIVFHAYRMMLAYGYGKPPETINLHNNLSAEQLLATMAAARRAKDAAAAEEAGGTPS